MTDFAFYNVGCEAPKGLRWLVEPLYRLLRRLLRPIFLRQVALYEELARRQERLEAFVCDRTALARRLAVLEDHLQTLLQQTPAPEERCPTIPVPGRRAAS